MQLFRTNASVDEKHNWFIVDFIAPAIATLLVSMMLVAMRYPMSTMEPAIDVERPREWTRKILVGGKPNHIDTLTAPSVLDVELAIENSTIIQWSDPSRATSIYFCIASSSKSNAASMPERRPTCNLWQVRADPAWRRHHCRARGPGLLSRALLSPQCLAPVQVSLA